MAVKAEYPCKQAELYSVAMAVIHSFTENQPAFAAFKGKYASPYENTLQDKLDAAIALAGFQMRDMLTEEAGIKLKQEAEECLNNWQSLKRYIRDVAAWEDFQKPRLEAAGSTEYERASSYNWEFVKLLNDTALQFINLYEAELMADDNMPAMFKASFEGARTAFQTTYNDLLDKKQDNPQEAAAKVGTNNELYRELMKVMDDGAHIFRNDEELQDRFVFTQVLNLVRQAQTPAPPADPTEPVDPVEPADPEPVAQGRLMGTVTRNDSGDPIEPVEIEFLESALTFETDASGNYESPSVPNGAYTVRYTHPEMEQYETGVTIEGDTVLDVAMTPLP